MELEKFELDEKELQQITDKFSDEEGFFFKSSTIKWLIEKYVNENRNKSQLHPVNNAKGILNNFFINKAPKLGAIQAADEIYKMIEALYIMKQDYLNQI